MKMTVPPSRTRFYRCFLRIYSSQMPSPTVMGRPKSNLNALGWKGEGQEGAVHHFFERSARAQLVH
jgi:hypothetical protein